MAWHCLVPQKQINKSALQGKPSWCSFQLLTALVQPSEYTIVNGRMNNITFTTGQLNEYSLQDKIITGASNTFKKPIRIH